MTSNRISRAADVLLAIILSICTISAILILEQSLFFSTKRMVIGVVILFSILVPFYVFISSKVLIPVFRISNWKDRIILVSASLCLGFLSLTFLPAPGPIQYDCPAHLEVIAEQNQNSSENSVEIIGMQIGDESVSYSEFSQQGWQRIDNSLFAPSERPVVLEWKARCFPSARLSFRTGPQGGIVSISWDNNEKETISLFTSRPGTVNVDFVPGNNLCGFR